MRILRRICIWVALILGFGHLIAIASLATGFAFTPHNASKAYIYFILFTQVPALIACVVFTFWLSTAIAFEKSKNLAVKLLGIAVSIYFLSWLILIVAAETGLIK